MKPQSLQDTPVNIKIKLAALWTSVMFCYIYGDYFELYVPGKIEGLISGDNNLDNPTKLMVATIVLAIPALMIACSILLPPKPNRLLNMVLGIFYTLVMLLIGALSLSLWRSFYVFLAGIESVLTFIIFWQALRWPRTT